MSNRPGHDHQREEARHDEVLDGVHAEHLQRVELLAHLARAEVGGDRRAGHAGDHDRGDERPDFADRAEHEEAAEAVERAEDRQEVRRLQPRRAVADGHRRDQQRKPAQPQREQELRDELAAVGVGRAQRGPDRPAREDHHVPEFLEHVPRGDERPLGDAANHLFLTPPRVAISGPQLATLRDAPLVRHAPDAPHVAALAARRAGSAPLVSWRDREGEVESRSLRARACRGWQLLACAAALAPRSRAAAAAAPGRPRTVGHASRWKSSARASPPSSRSRARRSLSSRCATRGTETVPNVAVTLDSFYYTSNYPNWPPTSARSGRSNGAPARSPSRPSRAQEVSQPGGGQTAYVNTWALGPLAPGRRRPSSGASSPSRPACYTVHYTVAPASPARPRPRWPRGGARARAASTVDIAAGAGRQTTSTRAPAGRTAGYPRRAASVVSPAFGRLSKDPPCDFAIR